MATSLLEHFKSEVQCFRPLYTGDFCCTTECNFGCTEVATSSLFISILMQFVSARLFLKQKLCTCSKVKLLLKKLKSQCFVSNAPQITAKNCIKIALKSQLVYTHNLEVATLVRQKLH